MDTPTTSLSANANDPSLNQCLAAAPLVFQPQLPRRDLSLWSNELVRQLNVVSDGDARLRILNLAALLMYRCGEIDIATRTLTHALLGLTKSLDRVARTRGALQTIANMLRLERALGREREAGEAAVSIAEAMHKRSTLNVGPVEVRYGDWEALTREFPTIEVEIEDFAIAMCCAPYLRLLDGNGALNEASRLNNLYGLKGGPLCGEVRIRSAIMAGYELDNLSGCSLGADLLGRVTHAVYKMWQECSSTPALNAINLATIGEKVCSAAIDDIPNAYRGWLQLLLQLDSLAHWVGDELTAVRSRGVQQGIAEEHGDLGLDASIRSHSGDVLKDADVSNNPGKAALILYWACTADGPGPGDRVRLSLGAGEASRHT